MPQPGFGIGELARRADTKIQTIRYYESIGLMPPPHRSAGNQRRYAHAQRLAFIRQARMLGFPLEQVRALLALADQPQRSCEEVDRMARGHLAAVEQRIAQLTALKAELQRTIGVCRGGTVAECRVIEALSEGSDATPPDAT